jgi:hypothetical protein
VKDGGLGSVDGCGEADTPGMNRSEVSGSYGIVLDFFRKPSFMLQQISAWGPGSNRR